jgi:FdhD protein
MNVTRVASEEIATFADDGWRLRRDLIAREEPLELQVMHGPESDRQRRTVAITMRTPGHDRELAVGFLIGEGLLRELRQLESVHGCGPRYGEGGWTNSVRVVFRPDATIDLARLDRNFYMTSSCGVCGKTSLEALELHLPPRPPAAEWQIGGDLICALPGRLRGGQSVFEQTGGLHAAGLFNAQGECLVICEDVGRHNAVDKAIGTPFLAGRALPPDTILVVSGRASFELVQKAVASGIGLLAAVGAPSSLAVDLAAKSGLTLVGFTKESGFNIYSGRARVAGAIPDPSPSTDS